MKELKRDKGKNRLELIPTELIEEVGKVLTFGANKYAPNAWREAKPEDYSRFVGAAMRHLEAYRQGEYYDPESKLPHLAHAATNLGFLLALDKGDTDVWQDLEALTNNIGGRKFTHILAVPRGGLVPAAYLAHRLGVKRVDTWNGKSLPKYGDTDVVLVVDDIADSGETLSKVAKQFKSFEGIMCTATIHMRYSSKFAPTFMGKLIKDDSWVVYPWENREAEQRRDNELGDN